MHDPRIGQIDDSGDRVIYVGQKDAKVAIYRHETRSGNFSVYLYENPNWIINSPWLMKKYCSVQNEAFELCHRVETIL